jgi:hypothetical protein
MTPNPETTHRMRTMDSLTPSLHDDKGTNEQTTPTDATLSWTEGETRGSAAMPIADFRLYVAKGMIELDA